MTTRTRPHGRIVALAVLMLGALVLLMPFAWMMSVSLGTNDQVYADPYRWFGQFRVRNYPDSLSASPFGRYYLNTLIVSTAITIGVLVTSTLVGYGLSKFAFRGRRLVFLVVLASMMVPFQTLLLPLFLVVRWFGWLDTYEGLIVPFLVQGFGIFFMRQYMGSIPDSVLAAARLDGANEWRVFRDIAVPMARPAIAALGAFTFVGSWNLFLWPLLVASRENLWTVQVGIADFYQRYTPQPELLMASAAMAMLPMIVLFVFLRRYFTEGVIAGRLPR